MLFLISALQIGMVFRFANYFGSNQC